MVLNPDLIAGSGLEHAEQNGEILARMVNVILQYTTDQQFAAASARLDAIIASAPADSVLRSVKVQLWKHNKGKFEVYAEGPTIFFTNSYGEDVRGADHVDQSVVAVDMLRSLCKLMAFFIACEGTQNGSNTRILTDLIPAASDSQVAITFKDIG